MYKLDKNISLFYYYYLFSVMKQFNVNVNVLFCFELFAL